MQMRTEWLFQGPNTEVGGGEGGQPDSQLTQLTFAGRNEIEWVLES